jgi:hypothetical protein
MLTDPGIVVAEVLRIVDQVTDPAGSAGPPAR